DHVAFAHRLIDGGNALRFVAWRHHATAMMLLQLSDAAGMVAMMVGDQDIAELPAGLLERRFHRRRLARIDGGGGAARLVMDEHTEIVLETNEEMSFCGHA